MSFDEEFTALLVMSAMHAASTQIRIEKVDQEIAALVREREALLVRLERQKAQLTAAGQRHLNIVVARQDMFYG